MKNETCYPTDTLARSITAATHANLIVDTVLSVFDRIAAARRERAAERARAKERVRTAKLIADLPYDIRADIGWPGRYEEDEGRPNR